MDKEKRIIDVNKMKEIKRALHITHNDGDAVGCAIVATNVFPNSDISENTHFCSIGKQDDTILTLLNLIEENASMEMPEVIMISDISLKRETCDVLEKISKEHHVTLIGIDHHITNNLDDEFSWWHVIKTKIDGLSISASEYMLNLFPETFSNSSKGSLTETLIRMISRYDTWEWIYHPIDWSKTFPGMCDEMVAYVCKLVGPVVTYKELLPYHDHRNQYNEPIVKYNEMVPRWFYEYLNSIHDAEVRYFRTLEDKARATYIDGKVVATILAENQHTNAACTYIFNHYQGIFDYIQILWITSNSVGLRSERGTLDVSVYAKMHNGGGHTEAAGYKVETSEMRDLLNSFMSSPTIYEFLNGDDAN